MAQPAFDLQNLSRKFDTLDSTGPTARNLQQTSWLAQIALSLLSTLDGDGATASTYTLSEDFTEAQRAAYKTALDSSITHAKDLVADMKTLTKV